MIIPAEHAPAFLRMCRAIWAACPDSAPPEFQAQDPGAFFASIFPTDPSQS